ncbi:LuxP protein precursor [Marinomonas sp. MED121]|nr:LuxP protein precursor [Marinomonas sp. MED121]
MLDVMLMGIRIIFMLRMLFVLIFLGSGSSLFAQSVDSSVLTNQAFISHLPHQWPLMEQLSLKVKASPAPHTLVQERSLRILWVVSNAFQARKAFPVIDLFKQRMQALKLDYQLKMVRYNEGTSYRQHIDNFNNGMAFEPDYVISSLTSSVNRKLIEQVLAKGKSKVIITDLSSPVIGWLHSSPLMYVGLDERAIARRFAQYVDSIYPLDAKIAAVMLPVGYINHARCDAFIDAMHARGRQMTKIFYSDATEMDAYQFVSEMAENNNPAEYIFSCSSALAAGVLRAIKQHNIESTTNSWRYTSIEQRALDDGRLVVTLERDVKEFSFVIAETIQSDLTGLDLPNLYIPSSALISAVSPLTR